MLKFLLNGVLVVAVGVTLESFGVTRQAMLLTLVLVEWLAWWAWA